MPKIKLNAKFTVDNKQYLPGVQDIPDNHLTIMKGLDILGNPVITAEQSPLVSDADNSSYSEPSEN